MKLYKFRPLATEQDFDRLKSILKTGEFWFSKFSNLNDPMEGSFTVLDHPRPSEIIDLIYNEKECYKICSFSNKRAFSKPIMWGYYANGFKGVAIEIEIKKAEIKQINYVKNIPTVKTSDPDCEARRILTKKLWHWKHEGEYRVLTKAKDDNDKVKIGKITALYFGDPYERADNQSKIIENSDILRKYINFKDGILKFLQESQDTKIPKICSVKINEDGKVIEQIMAK